MSDYLPDEVLANIFLRLPAKEVLDCRCVCKSWRSVISNSVFISDYTQLSLKKKRNNGRFILSHYDSEKTKERFTLHNDDSSFGQEYEELELPFYHGLSKYLVIGLCCGLVCMLEISKAERVPQSLLIWNPSVGYSFKSFPLQPPVCSLDKPIQGYGPSIKFCEEEAVLYSVFGFGFDMKSNDYKVVRIVYREDYSADIFRTALEIADLFSFNTGGWNKITESVPPYIIKESSAHAYVNGALHWIGYYDGSDERLISQSILAVFDLSDEVFREFKLPDELIREVIERGDEKQALSVGVITESLALMHFQSIGTQTLFMGYIWVMNEYGATESWVKMRRIQLYIGLGKILWLRRNGEFVVASVNHRDYGELFALYAKYQSARRLKIEGNPWTMIMDDYMECLVIYQKVNGVPTMSTSFASTTPRRALRGVGTSGLEITDKGKEIMEEE
ncbi:F-box protein [Melia azedarach]|uniref:F-box protein n=1 Tax=Melia azedarach TaxID=155640 RepID=A0ACC1XXI1_MELAZ|nr:F-box protein [Melia azedarach]